MRVLTFLHSFEPGGVERIALRLVHAWQEDGIDAPLLMGRGSGAGRNVPFMPRWTAPKQPWFGSGWCETLWMILVLPSRIFRWCPDLLFCAGNSYTVVAVVMKLMLGRSCPPIVAKISNDLDRRDLVRPVRALYHAWLRLQGRWIDHFVVMEDGLSRSTARALGVGAERVTAIADPALSRDQIVHMRAARTERRRIPSGRKFVAVGRLVPQKDYGTMLRAFAAGARAEDRLEIFGTGPSRRSLERDIARLDLTGRVQLAGHVADVGRQLPHFDALLLSSIYEGVPAVLIEALAAGIGIVATDCTDSIRPLLLDGALGRIVPPRDDAAFAAAIAECRPEMQLLEESLAQAQRFCIEAAAGRYHDCFEQVINRRRRVAAPLSIPPTRMEDFAK